MTGGKLVDNRRLLGGLAADDVKFTGHLVWATADVAPNAIRALKAKVFVMIGERRARLRSA